MTPAVEAIDHIHVHVRKRDEAEHWYARVLGLQRMPHLECWASDGGPLTLSDAPGNIHLALFERTPTVCYSTIALRATAATFLQWRAHLTEVLVKPPELEDHQLAWSLYFADPDGNPFEITCYEYAELSAALNHAHRT